LADGDHGRAEALYAEALELERAEGDALGAAGSLLGLATLALRRGDVGDATGKLSESLHLLGDDERWLPEFLLVVADAARHTAGSAASVRLHAMARALAARQHVELDPAELSYSKPVLEELRRRLGDEQFELEWSRGCGCDRAAALQEAFGALD
jgi:hypothetical protein